MKIQKLIEALLILISIVSGCSSFTLEPRAWTKSEKTAALFYITAHTADAITTENILNRPGFSEANPLMGSHPSDTEIGTYFALTGVITITIAHFNPDYRKHILYGYGGVNAFCAASNYNNIRQD